MALARGAGLAAGRRGRWRVGLRRGEGEAGSGRTGLAPGRPGGLGGELGRARAEV